MLCVGPFGLRVLLRPAQIGGPGRLGQNRGNPRPLQLLDHELPARALHRERHIVSAGEPLGQPLPQHPPAGRLDPAAPQLTGDAVQIIEGDLSTMNVKPSYRVLPTLLK
jgi:hypothetical protein